MNKTSHFAVLLAGLSLPLVGACNRTSAPPPANSPPASAAATTGAEPQTVIGKSARAGLRAALRELETGNLDIGNGMVIGTNDHGRHFRIGNSSNGSKAQLTPRGDLLIDGKPVAVTPAQREMLLDYRKQIIAVAESGMTLGVKGADLAGKAVLETFSGLMHGNPDEAGKRIEAEGKRLEADAKLICARLPAMLATQQRLAASLPAFEPYASMTQDDVDDCMKGNGASVTSR